MNRMIKLFQIKADNALEKYLQLRSKVVNKAIRDWTQDELVESVRLQTESKVWQRAAELLRKEELNK